MSTPTTTWFEENILGENWFTNIQTANLILGLGDDALFKCAEAISNVGKYATEAVHKGWVNVSNFFGQARTAASVLRVVPECVKIASGEFLWQTDSSNEDGKKQWRRVAVDENGNYLRISQQDLSTNWHKKNGVWTYGDRKSLDGDYIEDPKGAYIMRHWIDVVVSILVLIARVFSPIRLLHELKAIDLGEHAKAMGHAVVAIWSIVLTVSLFDAARELYAEYAKNSVDLQEKCWNVIQSILELITLPFEFGLGSGSVTLAIIGSILSLGAAISLIAKECYYYN